MFQVLMELQVPWESAFVKTNWIINLRSSYLAVRNTRREKCTDPKMIVLEGRRGSRNVGI